MKKIAMVVALISALVSVNASAEEWKKDDFIRLWNDVRKAISDGNMAKWEELTFPAAQAPSKQMSVEEIEQAKKDFAEAKDFILETFPDLGTVKFIKFDRNTTQAIFVLQTYLADETYITLDAFKFIKDGKNWKLSGGVGGISFPKKSFVDGKPEDIEARIKKELTENEDLQLNSEQKPAP
jgi:hypothetical protein